MTLWREIPRLEWQYLDCEAVVVEMVERLLEAEPGGDRWTHLLLSHEAACSFWQGVEDRLLAAYYDLALACQQLPTEPHPLSERAPV